MRRFFNRKKKIIGRMAAILITGILMICLTVTGIMASQSDWMPDLEDGAAGSLKVTMSYTDLSLETDNVMLMPGVSVKLVKVADIAVNGGSAEYKLLDAFESTGIDFTGMTASKSNEAAAALAQLADEGSVVTAAAGSDGAAVFDQLSPGMYLVFQDEDANEEYQMTAIAPFLVPVPYPNQSADENSWQYSVAVQPKTELEGARNNGVIRVTKQLFDLENELVYSVPEDIELVFYVGLFVDEACTEKAAGTVELPLYFQGGSEAEAVFENLKTDTTYYIAETDGNGNLVEVSAWGDTTIFETQYPDGQAVSITRQNPEGEITFRNASNTLPDSFYYGGILTVTKKTVFNGGEYETDDVFYAGIFTDAAHTERVGDVITLNMNGSSSVSVPINVEIGTSEDDTVTYYVTETDENGIPLDDDQEFTMTLSSEDGIVNMTTASQRGEVIITNTFTEEEPTPEPTEVPEETPTPEPTEVPEETPTPTTTSTVEPTATPGTISTSTPAADPTSSPQESGPDDSSTSTGVKTGDDTPIVQFVILLAAAALTVLIIISQKHRTQRR